MKFKSYNFREKQKKMQDMSCPPMHHSNPLIATLEAENLQHDFLHFFLHPWDFTLWMWTNSGCICFYILLKKKRKKGTVHKNVEMQYIIFWFVSSFLLLKIKLDQNWKVIMIPVFDYFVQCWCVSADQLILHLSFDTQEREIWILSKPVRGLVSQFKVRGMLGQTIKTENALGQ